MRHRYVSAETEYAGVKRRIGTLNPEPGAERRPEERDVCHAIAVIIARDGNVAGQAELSDAETAVRADLRVPRRIAWPPDRQIGLAVTVVVTGSDHVTAQAEGDCAR